MRVIFLFYVSLQFFFFLFFLSGCSEQTINQKKIIVVFRFDDPSAVSSTKVELNILNIFESHHHSLTFGVVPFKCAGSTRDTSPQKLLPLGEDKILVLKSALDKGLIDIALHGYSHQMWKSNIWSEFSGLDYDAQYNRLSKGKKYLEKVLNVNIDTFIPPYNTYDRNTLKALERLNFKILSAGLHGVSLHPLHLMFMPKTIKLHQLREAVSKAELSMDKEALIVVMFHEYDFLNKKIDGIEKRLITFKDLDTQLSWLDLQNNVKVMNIHQASKVLKDVSKKRYENIKKYYDYQAIIPGFIKKKNSFYPEHDSLMKTLFIVLAIYICVFLFGFLFIYKIVCTKKLNKNIMGLGIVFMLTIIVYILTGMRIYAKEYTVLVGLFGIVLGLLTCISIKKK